MARHQPGPSHPPIGRFAFDFVVKQRLMYVPNSGPPLAPISILPAHDKDGIILDVLELDGNPVYMVSFEDKPHLRVSVKPENVRNWVSARTHERWDQEQVRIRKEEERRARDENRKMAKKAARAVAPDASKGKPGRKRKRQSSPAEAEEDQSLKLGRNSILGKVILPPTAGPGRRRAMAEEEPHSVSHMTPRRSRGPSLSTPVKGLAEIVDLFTDEEDLDDSAALELQLNGGLARGITRRSSRSTSTHQSRSSSRGASLLEDNHASTSSRQARQIFEELEDRNNSKSTIASRYSRFPQKTISKFSRRAGMFIHKGSPSNTFKPSYGTAREYGVEVEEDEIFDGESLPDENESDTWEVDCILDDELRIGDDGKECIFYHIKWVGDWDNTWEPAINVGDGVIAQYRERNHRATTANIGDNKGGDESQLFVASDIKGKGKAVKINNPIRGQVVDDDMDDSSD